MKTGIIQSDKSYYQSLKENDIIGHLKLLFTQNGYKLRSSDGKIYAELSQVTDGPWVHIAQAFRSNGHPFDCYRWHKIMFVFISSRLKEPFVPSECHKCWKVVLRPKTLKQLFVTEAMQRSLGRPSKLGMEERSKVFGNWGAYWYNESMEEGIYCYNLIKEFMSRNEDLAPLLDELDENGRTTQLLLKRGCTEFEDLCGPSDQWKVDEDQQKLESLVNYYVLADDLNREQFEHLQRHVKKRWIEFAWDRGDPTVLEFANRNEIGFKPYVTYHQPELLTKDEESLEVT
jgi:hypothetical protein